MSGRQPRLFGMNRYNIIQSNEGDEENSPAAAAAAAAAKKKKEEEEAAAAAAAKSGGCWDSCFGINGFFAWNGGGCCLCKAAADCSN